MLWLVLAITTIVVLLAVIIFMGQHLQHKNYLAIITAGGVSNLIDYSRLQAVIDIFEFSNSHFNLADIYIFVGAISLIWVNLRDKRSTQGKELDPA